MPFWNEPARAFTIHLSSCCAQLCVLLVQAKAGRCCQEIMRGFENITYKGSLKEQNFLSLDMSRLKQSQDRRLWCVVVNVCHLEGTSFVHSAQYIKFDTVKAFFVIYSARVHLLGLWTFYTGEEGRGFFPLRVGKTEEMTSWHSSSFCMSVILLRNG